MSANKEKTFPPHWITGNHNDIGPEFTAYALPLIQGQPQHILEDGLPRYLYREKQGLLP